MPAPQLNIGRIYAQASHQETFQVIRNEDDFVINSKITDTSGQNVRMTEQTNPRQSVIEHVYDYGGQLPAGKNSVSQVKKT